MSDKIEIDIVVGKDNLSSSLDNATKKASKLEGVLETAVSVFAGNLLTKAFESVIDGLGGVISFTEKAIDAAADQEVATNNLNSALQRAGNYTKQASEELQAFSTQLQNTTKFEDDAIQSSTALLQSLTNLNVNGLKQGVSAATDFATVLGIDLETATRLVAKAANGNADAFARYGIKVEAASTASETFSKVLSKINDNFGGAAGAQLNTYNGSLVALGNAYADLLEPIGDIVVKNTLVIATFNAIKDALNGTNQAIGENNFAFKELVSDGILFAVAATQTLFDALDGITRVASVVVNSFKLIGPAITLAFVEPINLLLETVRLAMESIGLEFSNPIKDLSESLKVDLVGGLDAVKEAASGNVFTQMSDSTAAFGEKIIALNDQIAISAGTIKNSNAGRVLDEDDTNKAVVEKRSQLNADLAALNLQFSTEQQTFNEQLEVAKMEEGAAKNEAEIQAIFSQKTREAEAVYQGELIKNEAIKDAESQRIANNIASNKLNETREKAYQASRLTTARNAAAGQLQVATILENQKNSIIGASFGLAAALAKDGSKEQFLIQKAAALAEIAIAHGKAMALIPAQTAAIPYPENLAAAAQMAAYVQIQTALGAATVAATAIKGFAGGGVVGATSGSDNRLATVRDGEMILNASQQKTLFDAINSGGFGGGDVVVQIDGREIARATRNQIRGGFILA